MTRTVPDVRLFEATVQGRLRVDIADEREFRAVLSRRINDVLRASPDNNIRFLWTDDFVPGTVQPSLEEGFMVAEIFLSEDGRSHVRYGVTLRLSPLAVESYRKGEWSKLLPDPDSSGWLTISRQNREMEIRLR